MEAKEVAGIRDVLDAKEVGVDAKEVVGTSP